MKFSNHVAHIKAASRLMVTLLLLMPLFLLACNKNKGEKVKTVHSSQPNPTEQQLSPIAAKGLHIANVNGCFNCHSKDGVPKTGPTFKNLYNHKVTLKDGKTLVADTAYLRRAIDQPNVEIKAGYYSVMPKYTRFKAKQVNALIAYIKTLSDSTSAGKK